MKHSKKSVTLYDMCVMAIFTAAISILAQIAIPLPSGVPFTLQTFAITLAAIILGAKNGTIAILVYLLLGAVGIPVFSGFKGGLQAFVGPTGGFLLSFPFMTLCIGYGADHSSKKGLYISLLIIGNILNYSIAVFVYHMIMSVSIPTALFTCVVPFVPSTIISAVLASVIGFNIKKRLSSYRIS